KSLVLPLLLFDYVHSACAQPNARPAAHANRRRHKTIKKKVDEFEIPRAKAEKILGAHNGNLEAALTALVDRTA
ncbi:hypothetical protein FRB90_002432, partial [Tulasnella sp. 427]